MLRTKQSKLQLWPKVVENDISIRPEFRDGFWLYAIGKPATENRQYGRAVALAESAHWDAGWIRSSADVWAVIDGCWFDERTALMRADFFERFLRLTKGKWAGHPFRLLDYQRYDIVMPLFGWKRRDGTRRYRKGSCWMPKKNAKSALCSGIAILMLLIDFESSPEVYTAAGDRQQATIVHGESAKMIRRSPALRDRFRILDSTKTIHCDRNDGVYRALSADAALQEGLNWSCVLFDELHVQKNRTLYDALVGGGVAREQPLFLSISTSGVYDKYALGWDEWEYNRKVRDGIIDDWSYFAVAYYADRDADWRDPVVWLRANPGLGITINRPNFETLFRSAVNSPAKQNQFRRYHLNQWTQQAERFIDITKWESCESEFTEAELEGRSCIAAFDGSNKIDLCSWALVFPPSYDNEPVKVLVRSWVPGACVPERVHDDRVPYDLWIEQGWIKPIPGNVIDRRQIFDDTMEDSRRFNIMQIASDPAWRGDLEIWWADEGLEVLDFLQSMRNYTPALSELEAMILEKRIAHDGNPVLRWSMDNLVIRTNHRKEMMPDKKEATERIDAAVALLMALARYVVRDPNEGVSMYETTKISFT